MSLSYLREELHSLALIILVYLVAVLCAEPFGRIVLTIGGLGLCYLLSCTLVPDLCILLNAVWEARDFYYLPEACGFSTFDYKRYPKDHPNFEKSLRCEGLRLGLEAWRTYRHYTSPHFLLLYIVGLIFIYLIIKYTKRLLNTLLDNDPPVIDDLPAPPGGYRMFPHSAIERAQAEVEKLEREVEALEQLQKEVRAGAVMSRILMKAVHRKEVSTLRNQYRAEKRQIWLKSPESSSKHSPGNFAGNFASNFLFTSPAQGTARANRLQNELDAANNMIKDLGITASQEIARANVLQGEIDAANSKIKDLEIAASSPKASRKLTVKFAEPLVSNAAEAAEIARLSANLEEAKTEIEALKSTASSSSNNTSKNPQLNDDENKRLSERLHQVEEKLASTQQEMQSTKEKAMKEVEKVNDELKQANVQLATSRNVNKAAENSFSIMKANAEQAYQKTWKELEDAKAALATTQATALQDQQVYKHFLKELDDMKLALATAQAATIQEQQSMQQLQGQLESLKGQLQAATSERDQFRQQLDQCLASDPNELQAKLAAAEEACAKLQKENDLKESDIVENLWDFETKKAGFVETIDNKNDEIMATQDQLVGLRLKLNAEESKTVGLRLQLNAEESKVLRLQKDLELQRNQPIDLGSLRAHPEFVNLNKRYFSIQEELANAKQEVMIAQYATKDAKSRAEDKQKELSHEKDRIIDLLDRLDVEMKGHAAKTRELAALKVVVAEQGDMISKLQGIDDLF